ncbi:MAG TPA: CHAP domain-containing protein [Ktedonobacterales bacterium]
MRQFFLAAIVAASLVAVFAVPSAAKASGQCYWWWMQNGVKHYSYYDCAHPTKPPWQGGPMNPKPGSSRPPASTLASHPSTHPHSSRIFPNRYLWGQCTWWAAHTNPHKNLARLGNAGMWAINARKRGLHVGTAPRVGATAVFAGRVQGASPFGHVAHVVAVSGSRFKVSEMNYYGGSPRGGFGKVDYRWAHTGSGVSFIY